MANGRIKVDPAQLEDLITRLTDVQQSYLHFMQLTNKGVGYLINSLDPVLQCNISGKIDTVLSVSSDYLERLQASIEALRYCKETFQSADEYLAKNYSDYLPEEVREGYVERETQGYQDENVYGGRDFENLVVENPGYSGPCNMAAVANLINRRNLCEEKNTHVTWKDINEINNDPEYYAQWTGSLRSGIEQKYGYHMVYNNHAEIHNIDYISTLCEEHPEGIMIFAQGNSAHGVVLSKVNGEYMVTDSSGGTYSVYSESWMAKSNDLPSVEALLQNAYNIYYIE